VSAVLMVELSANAGVAKPSIAATIVARRAHDPPQRQRSGATVKCPVSRS
jgi:hypothetical protein